MEYTEQSVILPFFKFLMIEIVQRANVTYHPLIQYQRRKFSSGKKIPDPLSLFNSLKSEKISFHFFYLDFIKLNSGNSAKFFCKNPQKQKMRLVSNPLKRREGNRHKRLHSANDEENLF